MILHKWTVTAMTEYITKKAALSAIEFGANRLSMTYLIRGAMPEDVIPCDWIEKEIEWLKNTDNAFATLTAGQLSAMLRRWREGDHNEG